MAETAIARPDPLEDVLNVERELAGVMESERLKAARWLEERKAGIDRSAEVALAAIGGAVRDDEQAATAAREENAAALVENSRQVAGRLAALDEGRLRAVVRKHLSAILPGAGP